MSDLAAGGGPAVGVLPHVRTHVDQPRLHLRHRRQQAGGIARGHLHPLLNVALGNALQAAAQPLAARAWRSSPSIAST